MPLDWWTVERDAFVFPRPPPPAVVAPDALPRRRGEAPQYIISSPRRHPPPPLHDDDNHLLILIKSSIRPPASSCCRPRSAMGPSSFSHGFSRSPRNATTRFMPSAAPPPPPPLATHFAAASGLAASALRPFATILLASFLSATSTDPLSWSSSTTRSASGSSACVWYGVLRLALHAFLAAGLAVEALHVLACVCCSGNTPGLSALAALLRLLFRSREVRAAWNMFKEMTTRGPCLSLAINNATMLGFCHGL